MFEFIYKYQGTIERHLAAPLVEQRIRYLAHCKEQGMAEGTLQLTAQMMLVAIEELHLKGECRVGRRKIVVAADRWANREPRHYNVKHARKAKSHFISVANNWLHFLGWLREHKVERPYEHMLQEFADYMIKERGLSPHTLEVQCWIINDFLTRSCDRSRLLSDL